MATVLDPGDALRDGFSGEVLGREHPGFDEARRVFNGMIDRRPALIARCTTTADVVAAVELARERGLVVAVRCGGHSVAGLSTRDDGLLIDLGGLKSIAGGNIEEFTVVCEEARMEAFNRMVRHAHEIHADAIIGMRYDATEFGQGSTEVLAYGTAVKLK